ncbi:MAG: MBL fold metallo-hydrolase [Silvibacterium sp.]
MRLWKVVGSIAAALIVVVGLGLTFAPVIYAELWPVSFRLHLPMKPPAMIRGGTLTGPALGTVVDGYWRVQKIAPDTYAIGEPQNDPDNYEYLLIGKTRALLIDAGLTSTHDIHTALATLTQLPVTVIPTHLHFDHTNGLRFFHSIALIDVPETRSRVKDGMVHLSRYEYMGWFLPQGPPVFAVTEWVKPDGFIDLGGRSVQVLWTPGHTATSASFYDPAAKLLFTGDLIYPTSLYAFLPDSSLSAYEATATRLLATLPADTTIYGGHCCRNDATTQAPWLGMKDLRDVQHAVAAIENGTSKGRGFILRRFPVNSRMTMITLYPFGNR